MPTTIENECVTVTSNIIQDGVVNAGTEIEIKAPEKCSSWQTELSVSTFTIFFRLFPRFFQIKHQSLITHECVSPWNEQQILRANKNKSFCFASEHFFAPS